MTPLLQKAISFQRIGKLADAEQCYREAIDLDPANYIARHYFGMLRIQQGRYAEAIVSIDRAIALKPDYAEALIARGGALRELRRFEEALETYDRALGLQSYQAEVLYNRGIVLLDTSRPKDALTDFNHAVQLKPDYADAWSNRGVAFHRQRRFDEAIASFDRALALKPGFATAHYNRGLAFGQLGRFEDAIASYDEALAIHPRYADALAARGNALKELQRFDQALASYDNALAVRPGQVELFYNRGLVLMDLSRFAEALAEFDRAVGLKPDYSDAWHSRGGTFFKLQRFEEALSCYERTIALRPSFASAHYNRALCLWQLGSRLWEPKLLAKAVQDLQTVLRLDPDYAFARGDLIHLQMYTADWREFSEEIALINESVRAGKSVVLPFVYQAISESSLDLKTCATNYTESTCPAAPALWTKRSRRAGKIRIGYVCGEFRDHPTMYLTAGLYECHNKSRFEIVAFDNGQRNDSPMRRRVEAVFDKFISVSTLHGRDAAERVVAEDVDILVNLNGYYGGSRMDVFAHRPAPIQVNFLGFPGTLGATYIDYILADRHVIPVEDRQFYAEKVVYLPDSYQVNDAKRGLPNVTTRRSEHGLPEQAFVFCHFNYNYKLTPTTFDRWMRILRQTEGSVLWLLEAKLPFADNLRREAEARGVAAQRLIFAHVVDHQEHLARLPLADLFLDSLPYNAHTTASDALWMGLPLLTCRGTTFAGRVASSLLNAAGLPELVTEDPESYEVLALKLADDRRLLTSIRDKLAQNRTRAPLFDTGRFTRSVEAAYMIMRDAWQRGEGPCSFDV